MELMDELKQLVNEWDGESDRPGAEFYPFNNGAAHVYGLCADQLKTIIEANESKLPNLNIDIGEELPDLLKKQAE